MKHRLSLTCLKSWRWTGCRPPLTCLPMECRSASELESDTAGSDMSLFSGPSMSAGVAAQPRAGSELRLPDPVGAYSAGRQIFDGPATTPVAPQNDPTDPAPLRMTS